MKRIPSPDRPTGSTRSFGGEDAPPGNDDAVKWAYEWERGAVKELTKKGGNATWMAHALISSQRVALLALVVTERFLLQNGFADEKGDIRPVVNHLGGIANSLRHNSKLIAGLEGGG